MSPAESHSTILLSFLTPLPLPFLRLTILAALPLCASSVIRADAIDDFVRSRMKQQQLPGVALAVVRDGAVSTVRTFGTANIESGLPVTEDTVFELGSITKQFTAAAILMLVEEDRVILDDSIAAYLPGVPQPWRGITVRSLLTHSSGIQEYLSVPGLPEQAHAAASREAMAQLFFQRLKLEFAPGETWSYSNSGYLLLGNIIEKASGKSYWTFLRERIFIPLGMHATRSSEPRAIIRNRAAGYGWHEGRFENRGALSENAYGAGAIASTIRDMARWETALHSGRLLTRRSYDQMWTPLGISSGDTPPFSYGFGWVIEQQRGTRVVAHSGGTPGFSSAFHRYLDRGLSVIVLTNHGDRIIDHWPREIAGMVLPAVARRSFRSDPDPVVSQRLRTALRGLITGRPETRLFTPAMQLFLTTATGRGLWEWVGSHGELKALTHAESERVGDNTVRRYAASLGDGEFWFSFTMTKSGEIAQVYWW